MEELKCRLCEKLRPINRFSRRTDSGNLRTECRDCLNTTRKTQPRYRQWHKENKKSVQEYMRRYDLKRYYGITPETFEEMLTKQNYQCLICKSENPQSKHGKFHIDHCHSSGKVRGLLCSLCNVGLGAFRDNLKFLTNAMEYIKLNKAKG